MDTLILQVDCKPKNRDGPPQLGITVEAPSSAPSQQRQQRLNKDYRNHDYQNYHMPNLSNKDIIIKQHHIGKTSINSSLASNNKQQVGEHIQRGLQILKIQEGNVIDRNGQFRVGDIIVAVNNVDLQRCSFQEAQKTLREFVVKYSSHGPLLLKVLRKAASSSSIPSTIGSQSTVIERNFESNCVNSTSNPSATVLSEINSSINSESSPKSINGTNRRDFVGALNTRRIGTKHRIGLKKSKDGGFGIKIAERDNTFGANRPIYITAITTTGSAFRDGRLKEGDMLLEVNGIDLTSKSQPEVTKMLKAVAVNETVEFVISRREHSNVEEYQNTSNLASTDSTMDKVGDNNTSLIDLDGPDQNDSVFSDTNYQIEKKIDNILNVPNLDGPGTYVYDIPLNDTKSAGLGLYLKYPNLDGKDLGVWIEKVITGGAAWKDGRLQPDDQILAINGINLMGLSNAEASETLTAAVCRGIGMQATSNTIRLNIYRRDPIVVAKILQGTDNQIEHSNIPPQVHNKSYSLEKQVDNTQDSYQTALDSTNNTKSLSSSNETSCSNKSSNDTSCSNKSSNDFISQSDSAMSPQTQASNSLKLSTSCNVKSENNSSCDKTSSSQISQITDFTMVQVNDNITVEREPHSNDRRAFTLPKTLDAGEETSNTDASVQSWDDENLDTLTGEERFQRDGFGRRSISEKRHAQLMAENTDTFKRNQESKRMREELARQCQLEQLERHRSADTNRQSLHFNDQHYRISRNRKLNDSFRAAVDRSYESSRADYSSYNHSTLSAGSKLTHSVANSTASTSNDERCLIKKPQVNTNQKKGSSLLTKFLKFGSMKKKNKDSHTEPKSLDVNDQNQHRSSTRPLQPNMQNVDPQNMNHHHNQNQHHNQHHHHNQVTHANLLPSMMNQPQNPQLNYHQYLYVPPQQMMPSLPPSNYQHQYLHTVNTPTIPYLYRDRPNISALGLREYKQPLLVQYYNPTPTHLVQQVRRH